ncbi:MAG: GTP-binding protein [Chloroflexales bacterium]|nr:GTP-binding protein [Chloroflexales bacterium]
MLPPISIVTGFLGSGKTTLLSTMLERGMGGRRVALIVNEIGEIGFDGQVIAGTNVERIIELTSGCICCSIGTDFLLAVEEIIETVAPELIIIETTGLAEPWSLIQQVRTSGLPLDAVVTLVDAAHINQEIDMSPVARWQIRAADFLVLNKCDLVTAADLAQVQSLLHEQNSRAAIFETVRGELDGGIIFGAALHDPTHDQDMQVMSDHLRDEHIATIAWQNNTPLERQRLEATLRELPPQVYRTKGLIHCTDAPWPSRVNIVCGRVDYETTRLKHPPQQLNQLVLIGVDLAALRDDLLARLDACADTPARADDWRARQN